MTDVIVFKGNDGKLAGMGDKGRRAWEKFRRTVTELEIGDTLKLSFHLPRSRPHHSFFFAKLSGLFERQERFDDIDRLRTWLTVGAGYCDLMPGPGGALVAVPQSLAFHRMDEAEFVDLHQKITAFLGTEHAMCFLFPYLDYDQAYVAIEQWHREFDRGRP